MAMQRKRYHGRLEDLSAFQKRRFCSLSCANTRTDLTKHGYSWRARKHLKATCEACGHPRRLSRLLAHYGKAAWQDGSWENAVPRIAHKMANRVDRLRGLGNGQVPAVVALAWETLTSGSR